MARKRREPEVAGISAATHDGRGIAAVDGKKVFVAGALPGETVRFQRRKRRRNFDEAELLEVLEASPERVTARCDVYGRCGGCSLQHVSIESQRNIKEQSLRDSLERIGRTAPDEWLPPLIGSEWHYRRRARLAVKDVAAKGRTLVGFRERHAPFITDMRRCEVLRRPVDSLIEPLSELIGSLSIRARLPQIEVAVADNALALVLRILDPLSEDDERRLREFAGRHEVWVYLQPGGLDSIVRLVPEGAGELTYDLPEFDINIVFEPVDFVQINSEINERMISLALTLLEVEPEHRVLDLFCGIGNFSLPLARRAASVLGIEGETSLVERARHNARRNGLANADFRCADLAAIDGTESWLEAGCDRLLLDPARSGAEAVVRQIGLLDPERLVYVSCHPGTLARDAGILVHEQGYRLLAAGIIDMFPHTAHVESITVFSKQN
ncbi:MAG: 23S rRNA (uracil(1939)-C(5))-methyltransferase RlmD [Pseudomonadota bacterium]